MRQPKDKSIKLLQEQLTEITDLKRLRYNDPIFRKWSNRTKSILSNIFGQDSHQLEQFIQIRYGLMVFSDGTPDSAWQKSYISGLESAEAQLEALVSEIETFWRDEANNASSINPMIQLELIFERFHMVARQLRSRHGDRPTLSVTDEYDVQDLLHALLRMFFDDVRAEEWTPSYAGGSSRMDFLIHELGIVIEVKCTRPSMKSKNVGDELLIDVMRYRAHPGISNLYCFVYDPAGHLANPSGIERDLTKEHEGLDVRCYVRPK